MKNKFLLLVAATSLTMFSCEKESKNLNTQTPVNVMQRGAGLDLNVTVDADNTANEWMQAIEASLQASAIGVKIGGYGGGTDTATKWAAVLDDVANALGITVAELEDYNGINLLDAFFQDISNQQINDLSSGNVDVTGVVNAAGSEFDIYVGPIGTDVVSNPDFILHFSLI